MELSGAMQVRSNDHMKRSTLLKDNFELVVQTIDEDHKRFFKLFEESTFEGSLTAALEMKKMVAKWQSKQMRDILLLHSLCLLANYDSEMLSWPNSPLLVLLKFVDPNVVIGGEEKGSTLLHTLAAMADPFDYITHENQVILAKQLIEHSANVNTVSPYNGATALHNACWQVNVTNLDFVGFLLDAGADPNAQEKSGNTPIMCTSAYAPGAAKFLLNWPTTDVNITNRSGASFLAWVRRNVKNFAIGLLLPDITNADQVKHEFLLQQWRDIEDMLVEKGAHDTDITVIE